MKFNDLISDKTLRNCDSYHLGCEAVLRDQFPIELLFLDCRKRKRFVSSKCREPFTQHHSVTRFGKLDSPETQL